MIDLRSTVLAYLDARDAYERVLSCVLPACADGRHKSAGTCNECKSIADLRAKRADAYRALREAVGR